MDRDQERLKKFRESGQEAVRLQLALEEYRRSGTLAPEAREEYRQIPNYDYLVVNDKVSEAAAEIIAILTAEGCRTKNRMNLIEGV